MNSTNQTKTLLCYGDSNTWGNVPRSDDRYPKNVRWPGALQNLLGSEYEVVSEGLCGRTFVAQDPAKPHRTGITHLQAILESADPIDLLIIMLGTNDVKTTYGLSLKEIASNLEQTIEFVKNKKIADVSGLGDPSKTNNLSTLDLAKIPKILVICPPPVIVPKTGDLDKRMVPGLEAFKILPSLYKEVAEKHACGFINAGDYITSSKIDGYHLDSDSHLKLAEVISKWVEENV